MATSSLTLSESLPFSLTPPKLDPIEKSLPHRNSVGGDLKREECRGSLCSVREELPSVAKGFTEMPVQNAQQGLCVRNHTDYVRTKSTETN